jgi:polysaccharide pyruvyl transferase WcaK-like protein
MRIGILNNTYDGHYGCRLTMYALEKIIKKHGEIVFNLAIKELLPIQNDLLCPEKIDYLILNGEGTFHSDNRNNRDMYLLALKAKKRNLKVSLVNCSTTELGYDINMSIFDNIVLREKNSYDYVCSLINRERCFLNLDMVFYLYKEIQKEITTEEIKKIAIIDSVDNVKSAELKQMSQQLSADYFEFNPLIKEDLKETFQFLNKLNEYRYIISGRYHGVVFALILNKAVIALKSNIWKITGLFNALKVENYCLDTVIEIYSKHKRIFSEHKNPDINFAFEKQRIEETYKVIFQ